MDSGCVFCQKSVLKKRKQDVSIVSQESARKRIEEVLNRPVSFGSKYHRQCYTKIMRQAGPSFTSSQAKCQQENADGCPPSDHCDEVNTARNDIDPSTVQFQHSTFATDEHVDNGSGCDLPCNDNDVMTSQTEGGLVNVQCQCCRRADSDELKVNIQWRTGQFIKRRISVLGNLSDSMFLCDLCERYITKGIQDAKRLWRCGWPAAIAFILSKQEYNDIASDLWHSLPVCHRQCWAEFGRSLGFHDADAPSFTLEDRTSDLSRYETLKTSGGINDFITANDEFAFPSVRCPAGCFSYLDECRPVAFHNYIAWKYGRVIFDGDAKFFRGARADWPCSSLQLNKFVVMPALVQDEAIGLSVLVCSAHGNGLMKSICHVPNNPLFEGDVGLQCVDTCAAAILVPNIVRGARMGRWTNSAHVIQAVGGYTGISSSSIALRMEGSFADDRLGEAELLAMTHRPDVMSTMRERYALSEHNSHCIDENLWRYNQFRKPLEQIEAECLKGATVVDLRDSYKINERMFSRGTANTDSTVSPSTIETYKLSLAFVHNRHKCGCLPVDLTHRYLLLPSQEYTGLLLQLLIHCPPVHDVMLDAYERQKTLFLRKLLLFVKYCAGQAGSWAKAQFRNTKACEKEIVEEMTRRAIQHHGDHLKCQSIVELLGSYSDDMTYVRLAPDGDLCLAGRVSKIVFVYRNDIRSWRSSIQCQVDGYHLLSVFGGKQLTNTCHMRWSSNRGFWSVERKGKKQSVSAIEDGASVDSLKEPQWKLLVYSRDADVAVMNDQLCSGLKGQRKMQCGHHKRFLVKQPTSCKVPCCVDRCVRLSRWLCMGGSPVGCDSGVCWAHGNDFLKRSTARDVEPGMYGRRLPVARQTVAQVASEVRDDAGDSSDDCDDIDDGVLAPLGLAGMPEADLLPPVHSRNDIVPIYDVNRNISSHFLWNQKYNVMRNSSGSTANVRLNAMLEHIVTVTGNACVSLLYPEAQLFPRIFWCSEFDAVLGAMPSYMLNTATSNFSSIASLAEHMHVRLRDGCLLTATENGYWHYLFDLKLNSCLNHATPKMVFRRGVEFLLESGGSHKDAPQVERTSQEGTLPMDECESVRRVKELASMLKRCGDWTYFVTITCNDMHTPGVRVISRAIRDVAKSDANRAAELSLGMLPFVLRAWERFVRLLFEELVMRNDSILGRVKHIFYRFEFQGAGAKGNKPHVHCGITLEPEPESITVSRVCCDSVNFCSTSCGGDFETLHDAGVFTERDQYDAWVDVVSCVQHHDCTKTEYRCMKATDAQGNKQCRYKRQPYPPHQNGPWFEPIDMPYGEEAYNLLAEMGLAKQVGDKWVMDRCMLAGKWRYMSRGDEFFLASIPLLSAICCSSTNVDMCDHKFQVTYLIKYVSGKEEHQLVSVAGTRSESEISATTEGHAHEKIASCKKLVDKKLQANNSYLGREVSLCEVLWFTLGHKYTFCTSTFVHASTLPLECRAGVLKSKPNHSQHFRDPATGVLHPVHDRIVANMPPWRLFTDTQVMHLEDYVKSPYILDAASAYNIRPPELLFFDNFQVYAECFVAVKTTKHVCCIDPANQPWMDGASRQVKMLSCSISKAMAFVEARASGGDFAAKEMLRLVFEPIAAGEPLFVRRFVKTVADREVVSVVSFVKPWDRSKFVAHLCKTLGSYSTEADLFLNGDMSEAFVRAGLLQSSVNVTRTELMGLLRRYVREDLRFHPLSARQFGRYLKAAWDTLHDMFIIGSFGGYTPCVTDVMLKEQADEMLKQQEKARRDALIRALFDDPAVAPHLPLQLQTQSASQPIHFLPRVVQVEGLSDEAVSEQRSALACCIDAVDRFLQPTCRGVKFPCLVGRPGSGKSHVLKLAAAYCLCKGLSVEMLSWTSERARKVGGNHLHLVFPLVVTNGRYSFSQDLVNGCLKRLDKDPAKKTLLRRTDVFLFEELGLLSAEFFVALDSVLRNVMGSDLPWGGKLLMSCGDSKQLPPIQGSMVWSSVNMCTMMKVFVFKADVRARDGKLQFLNNECRRQLNEEECVAAAAVILNECTFARDWSDVPDSAVRIVPTKAAEIKVMDEFLSTRDTVSFTAMDEVQNGVTWEPAGARAKKQLDGKCYEYSVCRLYKLAVVRMTYNDRHCSHPFSQGQIAVVTEIPEACDSVRDVRLRLRLAPPGTRHLQDAAVLPASWPEVVVRARTTPPVVVGAGMQMGRRTQLPVRLYICSTIHRIQGETLPLAATQLTDSRPEYRLWQKEQLAVLISRVARCQDIIFVGSRTETRLAVERILACSSKWDTIVDHYLSVLDAARRTSHTAMEVSHDSHPFLPVYQELPAADCGYVFILVSMSSALVFYVGHAVNLKKALRQINTGYGDEVTRRVEYQPWGVYAFVSGFEVGDERQFGIDSRVRFAELLRNRSSGLPSVEDAYVRCKALADDWTRQGFDELVVVKCGRLV